MAGRSPARFLAPIALIAFAIALYSVVKDTNAPAGGKSGAETTQDATPTATSSKKKSSSSKKKKAKTYTVKSGDTLSGIAERNKLSQEKLLDLNPDLDPSTLAPGQKIKLSE
jgi:LysM repeat protein